MNNNKKKAYLYTAFCESHSGNYPWEEQTLKFKCAVVAV